MRLTIKRMTLSNFKGIRQQEFDFSEVNEITGQNGSGKSTIGIAYYWLLADVDNDLKSNPSVFNVDGSEASPTVEIIADIDGKQVTISRTVKRSVKASKTEGLGDSVSFSSTYTVNAIEFGLRDFRKKLEEYGITDKFITLSHPDSFLSEKKDEMRKTLFGMVNSITDLDIARGMTGVDEATKLLEDYSFEEVTAMQNTSLRKIREVYGKSGELLVSKIQGLESAKIDCDWSALELQKNLLNEKLEKCQKAMQVGKKIEADINELREQNMKLQFEVSGLTNELETEYKAEVERKSANKKAAQEKAAVLDNDIRRLSNEVTLYEEMSVKREMEHKTLEKRLAEAKALVMDASKTVCPVCNRAYDEQKIDEIKTEFEKEKAKHISEAEGWIKENESISALKKAELSEIKRKLKQATTDREELEIALNELIIAVKGGTEAGRTILGKLNKAKAELGAVNKVIEKKQESMPDMTALKAEEVNLNGQIRDCEIQLSKASLNDEIDNKIEALHKQQIEFEQAKADCERILYQLSLIQKTKNETLSDKINEHFKLVKWVLWDYQKNGDIKDVVVPTVDGKSLGSALNTALCIRAKLDIIQGLQTFYNEFYPVFLDQGEALDSNSKALINMPCQLTYLTVTNDKDLTIKEV